MGLISLQLFVAAAFVAVQSGLSLEGQDLEWEVPGLTLVLREGAGLDGRTWLWVTYLPTLSWHLRPANRRPGNNQGKDLGSATISLCAWVSHCPLGLSFLFLNGHNSFWDIWITVNVIRLHSDVLLGPFS